MRWCIYPRARKSDEPKIRSGNEAAVNGIVDTFLLVYASLFPIVNPIGGAPIFLGLTRHCSEQRNALALRVTINSFLLLVASLLAGSYVLEFFGVTLPILRIAGGLLVTVTGWKVLNTGDNIDVPDDPKVPNPTEAFYPLTMPITVGPGSIAVAIAIGSERPRTNFADVIVLGAAAIAGLVAIAVTIYVCYRFAENIVELLGDGGTDALVRLSAFILVCIGIGIIWSGWSALTHVTG
jgi:multiple antibiotic resistance protein